MSYREVIRGLSIKYLSKKEMELLNRILTQKYKNTNVGGSIDIDNRDSSSYKRKIKNLRNTRKGHPQIATIVTVYASLRCILMQNLSGNVPEMKRAVSSSLKRCRKLRPVGMKPMKRSIEVR